MSVFLYTIFSINLSAPAFTQTSCQYFKRHSNIITLCSVPGGKWSVPSSLNPVITQITLGLSLHSYQTYLVWLIYVFKVSRISCRFCVVFVGEALSMELSSAGFAFIEACFLLPFSVQGPFLQPLLRSWWSRKALVLSLSPEDRFFTCIMLRFSRANVLLKGAECWWMDTSWANCINDFMKLY